MKEDSNMAQYHKHYSSFWSATTPVVAGQSKHRTSMASKLQSVSQSVSKNSLP